MDKLLIKIHGINSERSDIVPLYLSERTSEKTIHTLAVKSDVAVDTDNDNYQSIFHFAWIKVYPDCLVHKSKNIMIKFGCVIDVFVTLRVEVDFEIICKTV